MTTLLTSYVRVLVRNSVCRISILLAMFIGFMSQSAHAQCTASSNTISGIVFLDENGNGLNDDNAYRGNILVQVYDSSNNLVGSDVTSSSGDYAILGVSDGEDYRIEFDHTSDFTSTLYSSDNGTKVQFATAPTCDINFGIRSKELSCGDDPQIILTCFVQGQQGENDNVETIIQLDHQFNTATTPQKLAMKSQTGSIWGIAWDDRRSKIFYSAFVKHHTSLTADGAGSIFRTTINNTPTTETWVRLQDLGVDVGEPTGNVEDCQYGRQVGRLGLGSLVVGPNSEYLYTVNLKEKTLVKINIDNPHISTTESIATPDPGCIGGDYVPFALKVHNGKIYVGTTCTAENSQNENDSRAIVYEFDVNSKAFTEIFSTNYIKGFWYDIPTDGEDPMHWLTDIDFTAEGNMLISLTDRVGHVFCDNLLNRVDFQNPDLLVVWDDNGIWKLEDNGTAGSLVGTGQGNNQGPGGGEFFGEDYWLAGPNYHPELALGSIFVLPGTSEVVASVYDPIYDTYSGGLHRYNTTNGRKLDAIQLYTSNIDLQLGKATGFGDIVSICPKPQKEIGNYAWFDENSNGIQDANEDVIVGLIVNLLDENCNIIGTTITNSSGQYFFNNTNVDVNQDGVFDGLRSETTYTVSIHDSQFLSNENHIRVGTEKYEVCSSQLGTGVQADENDSDITLISSCDGNVITPQMDVIVSDANPVNHSYDLGLCPASSPKFDLALIKLLVGDPLVSLGDTATFEIKVYNQGTAAATDIAVVDYLVSGYSWLEDINPEWKERDGVLKYNIEEQLNPGENISIFVHLKVEASPSLSYINVAEISGAVDVSTGFSGDDMDSTPDEDPNNDAGGVPNSPVSDDVLDGDGTVDEDDHDPERVLILDLALRKELKFPQEIYKAGDDVPYIITVFNQGSEEASEYEIIDYVPEELIFNSQKNNSDWDAMSTSEIVLKDTEGLLPGQNRSHEIVLTIADDHTSGDIINFAEISMSRAAGNPLSKDFDSKPDRDMTNDIGGQPNTNNDNKIDDYGVQDEDDHDPALLRIDYFDLALYKTVENESVSPGDEVTFTINIVNQGSITANNIMVHDYLPTGMTLADTDWSYLNDDPSTNTATFLVNIPGGLASQEVYSVDITVLIGNDIANSELINVAEIVSAQDNNGDDRSNDDRDSTPDNDPNNDMGGDAGSNTDNNITDDGTVDEDDHDPARVIVIEGNLLIENQCLGNATTANDGQFLDRIEIISATGESWYIFQVNGLFDPTSSAPPAAPVDFVTGPAGALLTETIQGNGVSSYTLDGIHIDDLGYTITLTDGQGRFETIDGQANPPVYVDPTINGALAVCGGGTETYSTTEIPGATYAWTVSAGGAIVGPVTGTSVDVAWGTADGDYNLELVVTLAGSCMAPASSIVAVGSGTSALACIGSINISASQNCQVEITPEMLLTSPINPVAAYAVVLMDANGNIIPNATLTSDYLWTPVMAKVMDGCSGNSCWSTVTLEDKIAPSIICEDITISCNDMLNYDSPLAIDNCDSSPTVTLLSEIITPLDCDPDNVKLITREYQAADSYGNQSDICTQNITVERLDISTIVYPDDFMVSDDTNLQCGEYPFDENGGPSIFVTGTPTLDGMPLYPTFAEACSVVAVYNDEEIVMTNCVRKIIRTWTIFEWTCSNNLPITYMQTIEVQDDTSPEITCPLDMTVASGGVSCSATVTLPSADLYDICSAQEDILVDITYPGGFIDNANGGVVSLPIGSNTVTYTAYDECQNSTSCSFIVEVIDETAPVTICNQETVVSINQTGGATVFAQSFDEGSFDDCSLDRLEVYRMDQGNPCGDPILDFGDSVYFCCADVGNTVVVVLRAYDVQGNFNDCMVNVLIQDKFAPQITCPADVTIDCHYPYDLNDLSEFGMATATDACELTLNESSTAAISQCGVGTIIREFQANDANGMSTCTQTITILNNDPFDFLIDIDWPEDYETVTQCLGNSLNPENLPSENGFPILTEDACDLTSYAYTDQVFEFVPDTDACLKILRKWSVIDWCQNGLTQSYDQIIKISNNQAPTLTGSCEAIETCSFDIDCGPAFVELNMSATDDCTPGNLLNWTYVLDEFSDGEDLITVSGSSASVSASANYPIGTHSIIWSFEDACGNVNACSQSFTVLSCKTPTAYCIDGISIALEPVDLDGDGVPDEEQACLFVETVDAGSYHSCDTPINLSFSADVDDDKITFTCLDLGPQTVELWVTDENGNTSFCSTTVEVQDNNDVDVCVDPKDCITPPTDIQVTACNADLSPQALGSILTVDPNCICGDYDIDFSDVTNTDSTSGCITVRRTWSVTFNCGNLPLVCKFDQNIEIFNSVVPIITCPDNVTEDTTLGSCSASVVLAEPTVITDCISGYTVTNDSAFADSNVGSATGTYPVGTTNVIYTVTDICGNSSTCMVNVTVNDIIAPICNVNDITVQLVNNTVTVIGAQFNNGSTDSCTDDNTLSIAVLPNTFDCNDIGINTVNITVTDENENVTNCTAQVTVIDDIAPVCILQDITVQVNDGSTTVITSAMLDNGSSDACGDDNDLIFVLSNDSFDCGDIGENTVDVTVTDLSGNSTNCSATVTVVDNIAPICILQDITINIDSDNNATINAADLDNGSFDDCGSIVSFDVVPSSLSCNDLGDNLVTVTVTDDSGNTTSCTTIVTVEDITQPICMVQDITVTLDQNGQTNITAADIDNGSTAGCDGNVMLEITPTSFTCNDVGDNVVTFTVSDSNGTSSSCTATVTVTDDQAPICILQDLTVNITENETYIIDLTALDNGSNDPCGQIVSTTSDITSLDCANVGDNLITVTVNDNGGNSTTCQATITVVDVSAPICNINDITVDIGQTGTATITAADIDNGSATACGNPVSISLDQTTFTCDNLGDNTVLVTVSNGSDNEVTCNLIVTVTESEALMCPSNITIPCGSDISDLSIFGTATVMNTCNQLSLEETVTMDLNVCDVGTIIRTFTATNETTNESFQCSQFITVTPGDNPLVEDDITFPTDTIFIDPCIDLDLSNLMGMVTIDESDLDCSRISISQEIVNDIVTCNADTLSRRWTVIDSCQLNSIDDAGIFTFDQAVVIVDTGAPIIDGPVNMTLDCGTQFVDLPATIMECRLSSVINDSPFADNNDSADASGTYPPGSYDITITAEDECGLTTIFEYNLTILADNEPPTGECKKIFLDLPATGFLTLNPIQHLCDLEDNCTDLDNFQVFYTEDFDPVDANVPPTTLIPSLLLDCSNVGPINSVAVAVFDESGNFFRCKTAYSLTDIFGICNSPSNIVDGFITTSNGSALSGSEVKLEGSNLPIETADIDGYYAFPSMFSGGAYNVIPNMDSPHDQGLSTLDLIVLQRHILGLDLLDNPYEYIAGDVNNSQHISAADIIELRKVIMGALLEFPNNDSWKMIDQSYDFDPQQSPLEQEYNQMVEIPLLSGSISADFVGVKIGDVNSSWTSQSANNESVSSRTNKIIPVKMEQSDEHNISFILNENIATYGMQLKLYSAQDLSDIQINSGTFEVNASNIRYINSEILISIDAVELTNVSQGDELFSITSPVLIDRSALDLIQSTDFNPEFYLADYEIGQLSLEKFEDREDGFVLYQNEPNPWNELTTIEFFIEESQTAEISIYDLTGKRLFTSRRTYNRGLNNIIIEKSDFDYDGMTYVELTLEDGRSQTIKMIKIK